MNVLNSSSKFNINDFGSEKALYSDRVMFDPQFYREKRSQSPLRVRDLIQNNPKNFNIFKHSKLQNSRERNVSVNVTLSEKPSMYEIGACLNSPKVINHSKLSFNQIKAFDSRYSLKFIEG